MYNLYRSNANAVYRRTIQQVNTHINTNKTPTKHISLSPNRISSLQNARLISSIQQQPTVEKDDRYCTHTIRLHYNKRNNIFSLTSLQQNTSHININISGYHIPTSSLHTSAFHFQDTKEDFKVLDEKSKIEEFVAHQKKKLEQKEKLKIASQKFQEAFIFKVDRSLSGDSAATSTVTLPAKKPLTTRILDELKHYYNGFKLLYLDVRIAGRLLWRVMNGKALTRRERKQFLRTVADLFRLVPFMVFLIVPFMEFLLPVAVKLFPNMLPSTFEDKSSKEVKRRASLKMRLQMAEFLQDTIEEIAVSSKGNKPSQKLQEFGDFVLKVRSEGERPTNSDIMKYAKLFEDEITLENLAPDQLKAMCRLIMISSIGTPNFLRFKIKLKLRELKADDQIIRHEGIDNLTDEELQNACVQRGMRALGVPVERMKSNLKQWLELSLDEDIPATLLLLSRTLYMGPSMGVDEQLQVTISQFPERLIDEMEVKIGAVEGEAVDRQTIIDIIKHEEEQIKAEKKEINEKKLELEKLKVNLLAFHRKRVLSKVIGVKIQQEKQDGDDELKEEILKMKETISTEREELIKIKEDREEYIGDLADLLEVQGKAKETVASSRLGKRIDAMLQKIDVNLKELEVELADLPDGKIDKDEDGIVTTHELFDAIQKLRNAPDETKTQRLLEVLDDDQDGEISLEELRKALAIVASEDLHLNSAQVSEVMALLKGTEKIQIIDLIMNKKKSNYILRLLPNVYGRPRLILTQNPDSHSQNTDSSSSESTSKSPEDH